MTTHARIFISHSSKDKASVRMLAHNLSEYGIDAWLDEDELALGDRLTQRISKAIDSADYFVIVLSSHSIESRWVQKELDFALTKEATENRRIIVPILLERVELPDSIKDRIFADFTDQEMYHKGFHELLRLLGHKTKLQDKLAIFSITRKLGWEIWSWDCDLDEKATEYVHSGSHSIGVKLRGYGGLALAFRSGVDTTGYKNLEFYINGGDSGRQKLKVYVNDKLGNGVRKQVTLDKLVRRKWKLVSIPLKELDAENIIIVKINFSNALRKDAPSLYLSDISLVA